MRREDLFRSGRKQPANAAHQRPLARCTDREGQPAARPAGGEDAEPRDVGEARADHVAVAARHQESNVRNQRAVEPALQDCRNPVPPCRVDEDQRVGPEFLCEDLRQRVAHHPAYGFPFGLGQLAA